MRKKLLWLTKGSNENLPSLRLRILSLAPWLDCHYIQSRIDAPVSLFKSLLVVPIIRSHDIVIIQKELVSFFSLCIIRCFSKRLFYDFDDAVYARMTRAGEALYSGKCTRRLRWLSLFCDGIIAGNEILLEKAKSLGAKNVHIVPTAVAIPEVESPPIARSREGKIVLGWIGTRVNLPYLLACERIFEALEREGYCFELHVMCDVKPSFKEFSSCVYFKWAPDEEQGFLHGIDIGLMPLFDNEHTRGKCAYKALQYMAFAKPVVVSDVGVNKQWIKDAGYAVATDDEWSDSLRQLISNPSLRVELGVKGLQAIRSRYTRDIVAKNLINIIG